MTIQQILTKYWGFSSFRPLQEDIINSVLEGKDTLALLPTGGGKSICFQVPGLAREGISIVVSPLIALMKDQVTNLKKAGIPAIAIFSGMHRREIDIALDNCIYGKTKFLYLSPERLKAQIVIERIKKMKVNLFVVDEAHCISQWGYDFRPSYMNIAEIRKLHPDVPIIALTATATTEVATDIQDKLEFKSENLLQKSFERKNLAYVVLKEDDKLRRLLKVTSTVNGTGIVYVRNRKRSREVSDFLNKNNVSSTYYHAGLNQEVRDNRQAEWASNRTRVIVSTNAFGMGIDKANVRFVVHLDIPDSMEAYFQEAGRAGRDEKKAYAVIIYNEADLLKAAELVSLGYPSIKEILKTYLSLGNSFQLAVGAGEGETYDLDINTFSERFKLKPLTVFNSLKFLERDGYLSMNDAKYMPSRVMFTIDKANLYNFQVENKNLDPIIKLLLRSYAGSFDDFVKIDETQMSNRAKVSKAKIIEFLDKLHKMKILTYIKQSKLPQLVYTMPRQDAAGLVISKENYQDRKENSLSKIDAMLNYVLSYNKCRSQLLLAYFGEDDSYRCGSCDVCLERNKLKLSQLEFDAVLDQVKPMLQEQAVDLTILVDSIKDSTEDKALKVIQWLIENGKIINNDDEKLEWVS